jgi:hypothetical protein
MRKPGILTADERGRIAFDRDEVPHHGRGRIRLTAAAAARLLASRACLLVEADAKLRRTLEDVEQLAERQIQQGEDHRHRVQDGQEVVRIPLHPRVAGRQQQAGDADREEQDQWQDVLAETAAA